MDGWCAAVCRTSHRKLLGQDPIPPENVWAEWSSEEKGDFRAFRADVEDLLQSSYTLLGTSIFDRLTNLALEALKNHAWLHLEATLFCLNALAETISDDDVVDTTLIHLFRSELLANMMDPALNMPYKTQQTAVTTMVSFTAFFERHTQFLPSMLTFLFTSLQSPALAGVAARAIFTTCDTCRKTLVSEIGAFLHQYEAMLQWQDVESTTKEKVIGAIAAITQAISSEEHRVETFDRLLYFVHRDVQACKELASAGAMEGAQEKGLCALRCLINMGNTMQEPDPDGEAIDLENEPSTNGAHEPRIWESCHEKIVGFIYAVSSILGGDGEVVEAACQVLRTGYKEATPGPFVFPPKVTEDFVTNSSLQTPRLEYVLDTAGAMLTRHTRANASRVDATAVVFLTHLFRLIGSMGCKLRRLPVSWLWLTQKQTIQRMSPRYLRVASTLQQSSSRIIFTPFSILNVENISQISSSFPSGAWRARRSC